MATLQYICPRCQNTLTAEPARHVCAQCDAIFLSPDGFPNFLDDDYEWGYGTEGEQDRLVRLAEELGWRDAVARVYPDPNQQEWLTDVTRGKPGELLNQKSDAVALDVGEVFACAGAHT